MEIQIDEHPIFKDFIGSFRCTLSNDGTLMSDYVPNAGGILAPESTATSRNDIGFSRITRIPIEMLHNENGEIKSQEELFLICKAHIQRYSSEEENNAVQFEFQDTIDDLRRQGFEIKPL